MKLRSDKAKDKFVEVMALMCDRAIKKALCRGPVMVNGVEITRRELLAHLLS